MYEIEEAIANYRVATARIETAPQYTKDPKINYERIYIGRFNPVDTNLITGKLNGTKEADPRQTVLMDTEDWSESVKISNVPEVVFFLPGLSYALVTMDLRHIKQEIPSWTYGEDWAISFTMSHDAVGFESQAAPAEMPEAFLNTKTSKSQVFEFLVFAWDDQYMRIDVLLYNSLYTNYKYLF